MITYATWKKLGPKQRVIHWLDLPGPVRDQILHHSNILSPTMKAAISRYVRENPPKPATPPPPPGPTPAEQAAAAARLAAQQAAAAAQAQQQATAKDQINTLLNQYGLSSLADWAWQRILDGDSPDQVYLKLLDTDAYKARFPGMETLREKGRAISENEWISYEKTASQLMKAAGLPAGFYDQPSDFGRFITNDISVAELQQRIQQAEQAAQSTAGEIRSQLQELYGLDSGSLTAYFLDPDKAEPLLKQQFTSAQVGAQAKTSGYGQLTTGEAERVTGALGDQPAAVAGQRFGALASQRELFSPLDQGEDEITRGTQLAAAFEDSAPAQSEIERRANRRKAQFSGGGGFAASQSGFSGVR